MKTKHNTNRACKMATAFMSVVVFSAVTMAQSQPQQGKGNAGNVMEAMERLNAFMVYTEQSLRYEAPSIANDDLQAVWERLEVLAEKNDRELRYKAPEENQENTLEYAKEIPAKVTPYDEVLSFSAELVKPVK